MLDSELLVESSPKKVWASRVCILTLLVLLSKGGSCPGSGFEPPVVSKPEIIISTAPTKNSRISMAKMLPLILLLMLMRFAPSAEEIAIAAVQNDTDE